MRRVPIPVARPAALLLLKWLLHPYSGSIEYICPAFGSSREGASSNSRGSQALEQGQQPGWGSCSSWGFCSFVHCQCETMT